MTRSKLFALACLLAATMLSAPSQGQQQPTAPGAQPPAAGARPPAAGAPAQGGPQAPGSQQSGPPPGGPEQTEGPPWPIMVVTSIEVLRSARAGGMDVVR
ncbi:MAG TPA: hypothetical protein VF991_11140, partial [Reyranella sp.]